MNKFVILALVALQVAAISALPPCVCKRNYKPVCGSDGNTYSNQCTLDCESGKRNVENLIMAKEGPCKPEDVLPICICTYEYKPVCGSDGVTYPNSCSFDCVRSDANPITVLHEGQCAEKVKVAEPIIPNCICTREDIPVCGTNGVTYANNCLLKCATANDPSLSLKHAGSCETDSSNVPVPPCTCTRNLKPVCGSDGVTYNNDCLLNCATANDPSLSIKHAGGCETDSSNVPVPPCTCTRNLKPVCGSDGKTYNNDCLLNCATANDPSLSIKHAGGCETDSSNVPVPPCTCTRNLKPVCGSDGKTYNNDCLLNCATANDPSLSIKHAGSCETDSSNVPVPPCTCTRNLKPVCGSDGVTYNNDCLLNCATANNSSLSIAHDGEC